MTLNSALAVLLGACAVALVACTENMPAPVDPPAPPGPGVDSLSLEPYVTGLSSPVDVASPLGDPRMFIVEQQGQVRIATDGTLAPEPFLDIRARVAFGGERGLLSLAFPSDYATGGVFYVHYTDDGGNTRVSRFAVTADPDRADADSEEVLLSVSQPFSNHNGGRIAFGPDGMLYIGLGDGGSGGDPLGSGQDGSTLLGALLRVDVSGGGAYTIPPDNPFVSSSNVRPEIWATGLRNPWRFSFDEPTDRLYIGDVGQNRFEEIDVAPIGAGGLNYGWNMMEGLECFTSACDAAGLTLPVYTYGRGDGCSVTGGLVYRGTAAPALVGAYLLADYCQGWIRAFRLVDDKVTDLQQLDVSVSAPTSFGTDGAGEAYIASGDGTVYRFVDGN